TLQILEFHKVRELLSGYAASSLGKELIAALEPSLNADAASQEVDLVTEMALALDQGHSPPLDGLTDVRLLIRRATIGSMLTAEQLLELAHALTLTGAAYRYRMRLDERCRRLLELLQPVEDLGTAAKAITGCIDPRGNVLDMASPQLAEARARLAELD